MAECCKLCREEFRKENFLLDHPNPGIFVKFQCGCLKPYIAWRVFWALYHLGWIIYTGVGADEWAPDPSQEVKWFIFLTNWAYFTLTISTLVDAIVVIFIVLKRRDIAKGITDTMPWYLKANWVVFNLSNVISITMSIAFWALVYFPGYPNAASALNISTHVINAVYVIINLSVTGMPVRILHFWHPIIYGLIYSFFSLFYHLADGTNHNGNPYIYKPINWHTPGTAVLYCILITFVAVPVIHMVCFGIHFLKVHISMRFRCCGRHHAISRDITELERSDTATSKGSSEPQLYN